MEIPHDDGIVVYDRLYKEIPVSAQDLRILRTPEFLRLARVSLSAIPTWVIPTGVCASKAEHSIGCGHLAKIVGTKNEVRDLALDLVLAAYGHDLGTPPFSHLSERFQVKVVGKNHEQFAEDVIGNSEFARVAKTQGGNIDTILSLIKGELKPFSDLLNGTIDIDNLDNSLRYGLSMGLIHKSLYSPEKLADCFILENGLIALKLNDHEDLKGWEECRKAVYNKFVYSVANLSPAAMLNRALDFAFRENELKPEYFLMADNEAFDFLMTQCNARTRTLVDRTKRWLFYPRLFDHTQFIDSVATPSISELFDDTDKRSYLADEISNGLRIPSEDVAVYIGRNRGFKKIHLPIYGINGGMQNHVPINTPSQMVQVYTSAQHMGLSNDISAFMKDRLGLE